VLLSCCDFVRVTAARFRFDGRAALSAPTRIIRAQGRQRLLFAPPPAAIVPLGPIGTAERTGIAERYKRCIAEGGAWRSDEEHQRTDDHES